MLHQDGEDRISPMSYIHEKIEYYAILKFLHYGFRGDGAPDSSKGPAGTL